MILIETERNTPKFGMGVFSIEKAGLVISAKLVLTAISYLHDTLLRLLDLGYAV